MNHGLPAVTGKLILQPFQYQTSVCFALHIDEVDQDDSCDIPKPDLDGGFITGLQVGRGNTGFLGAAAGV